MYDHFIAFIAFYQRISTLDARNSLYTQLNTVWLSLLKEALDNLLRVYADREFSKTLNALQNLQGLLIEVDAEDGIISKNNLRKLCLASKEAGMFSEKVLGVVADCDFNDEAAVNACAKLFLNLMKAIKDQYRNQKHTSKEDEAIDAATILEFLTEIVNVDQEQKNNHSNTIILKRLGTCAKQSAQVSGIPMDENDHRDGVAHSASRLAMNVFNEDSLKRLSQYSKKMEGEVRQNKAEQYALLDQKQLPTKGLFLSLGARTATALPVEPDSIAQLGLAFVLLLGREIEQTRISTVSEALTYLCYSPQVEELFQLSSLAQNKESASAVKLQCSINTVKFFVQMNALTDDLIQLKENNNNNNNQLRP